jgi:hypothetical protein
LMISMSPDAHAIHERDITNKNFIPIPPWLDS